jgi:hypothetical protein
MTDKHVPDEKGRSTDLPSDLPTLDRWRHVAARVLPPLRSARSAWAIVPVVSMIGGGASFPVPAWQIMDARRR